MYQSLLTFSAQNITYLLLRINKQCVSEEMIDRHAKSICDMQIGGQFCGYPARLYFRYLLLAHICLFCKLLLRYTLPPAKPTNILPQHFMKSFGFEVIIVVYCACYHGNWKCCDRLFIRYSPSPAIQSRTVLLDAPEEKR